MTLHDLKHLSEKEYVHLLQLCMDEQKKDLSVTSVYARQSFELLGGDKVHFMARKNKDKHDLGSGIYGWGADPTIYSVNAEEFLKFCEDHRGNILGDRLGII